MGTPLHISLGRGREVIFYPELANLGEIRVLDVVRRITPTQPPFHVGLTTAKPDIPQQQVLDQQPVLPLHGHFQGRLGNRLWPQSDLPPAIRVGNPLSAFRSKRHPHRLARLGPAPHRQRPIPLEHHVVCKQCRYPDIRPNRTNQDDQD